MTTGFRDWGDTDAGNLPAGITELGDVDARVANDTDAENDKTLQVERVSGGSVPRVARLDNSVAVPDGETHQILARCYREAGSQLVLAFRADVGSADSSNIGLIRVGFENINGRIRTTDVFDEAHNLDATGQYIYVRAELEIGSENTLRAKIWSGSLNDEPASWQHTGSHTKTTGGDHKGLQVESGTANNSVFFDWVSWSDADGVAAPGPDAGDDPPAGTVTIDNIDTTHDSATVSYSYSDTDEDGFEYRLNGGTPVDVGTDNPFTITGLDPDTTYDNPGVEVRAYNAEGTSDWSVASTFTTDSEPADLESNVATSNSFTTDSGEALESNIATSNFFVLSDDQLKSNIVTSNSFLTESDTINILNGPFAARPGEVITLEGQKLDLVTEVTYAEISVTIDSQSESELTFAVPDAFSEGLGFGFVHDIVVSDESNTDSTTNTLQEPSGAHDFGEVQGYDELDEDFRSWFDDSVVEVSDGDHWITFNPNNVPGLVTHNDGTFEADDDGDFNGRVLLTGAPGGVDGEWTNELTITYLEPPPIPSNLRTENISTNSARAAWDSADPGHTFDAEWRQQGETELAGSESGISDSFQDMESLVPDTNYEWRVRAIDSEVNGEWSEWQSFATFADVEPPENAPEDFSGEPSGTSIEWSWSGVADATGYVVEHGTVDGPYTQTDVGDTLSFNNTGLDTNTTYEARVWAYNNGGPGPSSSFIHVTTLEDVPQNAPAVIEIEVTHNEATVVFDDVSNTTGHEYRLNGGDWVDIGTSTTFTITGLDPNTTYDSPGVEVRGYNEHGPGPISEPAAFTTLTVPIPSTPDGLTGDAERESIDWTWNSADNATGYRIEHGPTGGPHVETDVGNVLNFTQSDLIPGASYEARVQAYNESGASEYSTFVSVQTEGGAPETAPVGLAGDPSWNVIDWTWGNLEEAEGYVIEHGPAGGPYEQTDVGDNLQFSQVALSPDTAYEARVWGYNIDGEGPASEFIQVITDDVDFTTWDQSVEPVALWSPAFYPGEPGDNE